MVFFEDFVTGLFSGGISGLEAGSLGFYVFFLTHIFCLVVLLIGSFTDLKTREVPDFVSYTLIFGGFGLNVLYSVVSGSFFPILFSVAGFIVFFGIGMLLFYSGQFGGADAKLLMGLGSVLGFAFFPFSSLRFFPLEDGILSFFLISFCINLLFVGAVYGLFWALFLVFKNRKAFLVELRKILKKKNARRSRSIVLALALIMIFLSFFVNKRFQVFLLLLAFFLIVSFYLWVSAKVIEKSCMQKFVAVEKLTEGDWIVEDIKLDNKRVCGPKDLGISKEQISILVKNKDKIPEVLIKDGIPFVPSFLIAYIITLFFRNLVFFFV